VPDALPPTTLIVCSRNRPALLIASVESVLAGDELPAEIVVVDQSDEPNAVLTALSHPGCNVRYLHSRTVGLSRANNAGIAAARHDVLAFTHDDVRVTPEWLGALVRALLAAGADALVTGQVRPDDAERPGGFAPSTIVDPDPAVYEGRVRADPIYPLNMAVRRSTLERIGGFDVRLGPGTPYPGGEDNDLGFRLLEAGCRIVYAPEAVLYHRAWRTDADYFPLRWSYARAQGAFLAKHFSLRDRFMLGRFFDSVREHIPLARRGRRNVYHARADALYVAGLVSGAASWLLTHRGDSAEAERLGG
jgi:GT2 family glycosyltransferase